jgi:L-threonylcarbamoyladenylate synthase
MPAALVIPTDHPDALNQALSLLSQGKPVAFPTDTVYGLGVLASHAAAIDQLFFIKGRETSKAIAVLIGQLADLSLVTDTMNETALQLVKKFWPGALTVVVPRHPGLPVNLSPSPTIGVRMPDHPAALALLQRAGPLAVTSANLSGRPSTVTAAQVLEQLGSKIPLILDGGQTPGGMPSTVVDCTAQKIIILREGPISRQQFLESQ